MGRGGGGGGEGGNGGGRGSSLSGLKAGATVWGGGSRSCREEVRDDEQGPGALTGRGSAPNRRASRRGGHERGDRRPAERGRGAGREPAAPTKGAHGGAGRRQLEPRAAEGAGAEGKWR